MTNHSREDEKVVQWLLERWQEGDVPPWRKPWTPPPWPTMPHNPFTKSVYHGGNAILLHLAGVAYDSPLYATYKQIQDQGGQVRRGEHGVPIIVWKEWTPSAPQEGSGKPLGPEDRVPGVDPRFAQSVEQGNGMAEPRRRGFAKVYRVFNLAQTDGLDALLNQAAPEAAWDHNVAGRLFLERLREIGVQVEQGLGDRAYCQPGEGRIVMPAEGRFATPSAYYGTLLHEAIHSSKNTLQRPDWYAARGMDPDQAYAAEELVAELGMLLLARRLNVPIAPEDAEQTASYLKGWTLRAAVEENPRLLYQTARLSQAAVDHLVSPEFAQRLEETQKSRGGQTQEVAAGQQAKQIHHQVILSHRKDLSDYMRQEPVDPDKPILEIQNHNRQAISGVLEDFSKDSLTLNTKEYGVVSVDIGKRFMEDGFGDTFLHKAMGQPVDVSISDDGRLLEIRHAEIGRATDIFDTPAPPFGLMPFAQMDRTDAKEITGTLTHVNGGNLLEIQSAGQPLLVSGRDPDPGHQAAIRKMIGHTVTVTPSAEGALRVDDQGPDPAPQSRVQARSGRRP